MQTLLVEGEHSNVHLGQHMEAERSSTLQQATECVAHCGALDVHRFRVTDDKTVVPILIRVCVILC